jgi:hypothetical protein
LHEVTSERDPEGRLAAIKRPYVDDLSFWIQKGRSRGVMLLATASRRFSTTLRRTSCWRRNGAAYVGPDTAAQPWRFGPPGNPVIRGMDVVTLRDGMVSIVRGLVAG